MLIHQILVIYLLPKLNRHHSFSVYRTKIYIRTILTLHMLYYYTHIFLFSFFFICNARSRMRLPTIWMQIEAHRLWRLPKLTSNRHKCLKALTLASAFFI